jgi:hypothetical protein
MSMENYADRCGWNVETQLELALRYIANQGSDDAFDDFLQEIADEECAEETPERTPMSLAKIRGLQRGDSVYWNDPDEGTCSRILVIGTIEIYDEEDAENPVVMITEPDGSYVECFASELS